MKNKIAVLSALGLMGLMALGAWAATAKSYRFIAGNTSAVLVNNGPTVVYSVIMSSFGLTTSDFLVIRDSNTANTSSTPAIPPIAPTLNAGASGGVITFTPPIQLRNGLSVNLTVGVDSATIVYESGRY